MGNVSRMDSAVIGPLVVHIWHIVELIMGGSYPFDARTFAFHFYLNACDMVTAKGDKTCLSKFPHLANYVETVLQKMFQHYAAEVRKFGLEFGCGNRELFGQEIGVSGIVNSCCFLLNVRSVHQGLKCFVFYRYGWDF